MIMPTFRDVFEAYGADYDTTMARFMGNEAMYLQLLDMLFQDENMQKLGAALAKAAEKPCPICSSFADRSTPCASRNACPTFPNR